MGGGAARAAAMGPQVSVLQPCLIRTMSVLQAVASCSLRNSPVAWLQWHSLTTRLYSLTTTQDIQEPFFLTIPSPRSSYCAGCVPHGDS